MPTALRDVARQVPADRLLVETDSPYLAPIPYRGKANLPQYVREVAEFPRSCEVFLRTAGGADHRQLQVAFPLARVRG